MAEVPASITLDVSAIPGEWCDICCLSSALRIDVVRIRANGVSLLSSKVRCINEDQHDA